MPECKRSYSSEGKGNKGKVIVRERRVCAAGVPTAQPDVHVADALQHYLLKDEVDAIVSDSIMPPPPPRPLLPIHKPVPRDQRYAGCGSSDLANLVNPPNETKFQALVNDVKDTPYKSYWKKKLGKVPDYTPMLPLNFNVEGTTFGKKTPDHGRLYELIYPIDPVPGQTPPSKLAAVQTFRNYCQPAFNPDLTYGHRTYIDKRGIYVKCCLSDGRVNLGTANCNPINVIQADCKDRMDPIIAKSAAPNNNLACVPEGYTFGKTTKTETMLECLTSCELKTENLYIRKSLAHLNTLRKVMSTRFLPTYFRRMYFKLKYYDKENTGWLPKEVVYSYCSSHLIRFDQALIERILFKWKAFHENNIEYKTFCHILNFKESLPDLPKIEDIPPDCLDFRTTYREMTKPCQEPDGVKVQRAGVPSGRYLDRDYPTISNGQCKAHAVCLPQETDMEACLKPSILTLLHVNHRDMYGKREPHVVRRVFEAAGETFTDARFNEVWEAAKKYHSQGWVCYETFYKALTECPTTPEQSTNQN